MRFNFSLYIGKDVKLLNNPSKAAFLAQFQP